MSYGLELKVVNMLQNYKGHIIRKWAPHYLEYDKLKNSLQHETAGRFSFAQHTFLDKNSLLKHYKSVSSKLTKSGAIEPPSELLSDDTPSSSSGSWDVGSFKDSLLREVYRIENFVIHKIEELESQLQLSMEKANQVGTVSFRENNAGLKKALRRAKKDRELSVLRAYTSLYHKIEELQSFSFLNLILCIKILKKHDKFKATQEDGLYPYLLETVVQTTTFGQSLEPDHRIGKLKCRTLEMCAEFCCDGNILEARGKLEMFKDGHNSRDSWRLGVLVGLTLMLLVWFVWEAIIEPAGGKTLWNDPAIYLYSFLGNLLVYDLLWALNVYAWEIAHVNYHVLLDLRADHSPSSHSLMMAWCPKAMIFLANITFYYRARRHELHINIGQEAFPLSLSLLFVAYATLNVVFKRHLVTYRLYSPNVLFRIVTAPFSPVTLRENVLGDVMTSLIKVFSNCAYAVCYLLSGAYKDESSSLHSFGSCDHDYMFAITSTMAVLPLWFRFAQCLRRVYEAPPSSPTASMRQKLLVWPHSYNAIKYLLSMVVVIFGLGAPSIRDPVSGFRMAAYRAAYIALLISSTLYSTYWDIYNDFGLMKVLPTKRDVKKFFTGQWHDITEKIFLRKLLMYKKNIFLYYVAIVLDFLLRAMWTLSLIPQGSSQSPFSYSLSDQLGPFLAMFELCRRCMWLMLKLEFEHINAGSRGEEIALHIEKNSAVSDPNRDVKVVLYHLAVGTLLLAAVIVLILSI